MGTTGVGRRPTPDSWGQLPLGARIRAARQKRQVGVRELGRQIGVTGSLISQIESGKVLPSVTTLFSVMSALDIPVTEMLGDVADTPAVPAVAPAPTVPATAGPEEAIDPVMLAAAEQPVLRLGSGVTWHVLNPTGDNQAEFLRVIYEPGASSSGHGGGMLVHAGWEYGVVISGRLTVRVRSKSHQLGPGDTISFDASQAHRLSNDGAEPVVAIWFIRLDPA